MVGRRGALRIARFAHFHPKNACSWGVGETADHLRIKWAVVQLVRALPSWRAEMEVRAESGSWCADVLAVRRDGRRAAIEEQLAAQTIIETEERVLRYASDAVETV